MGLVVVGASANIARIARRLDDGVVFVDRLAERRQLPRDGDGTRSFTVNWDDEAALTAFAEAKLAPLAPQAVVSVTEHGLLPAAILTEVLGTPGVPVDVVRATRDKRMMRALLAAKRPHLTVDWVDASDEAAVAELLSRCEQAILKPAFGTASANVSVIRSPDDLRQVPDLTGLILEEFAGGTEYSVESFVENGRHQVVGIAEKGIAEEFVEVSHVMGESCPADRGRLIGESVAEFLDAIGLVDGPAHTELKVDGDTVKIIETHNRPGGDCVADLVAITTGIDWRKVCLGWTLGERPVPGTPRAPVAASVFITAPPGSVIAVRPEQPDLPDATVEYWKVDTEVGDAVAALGGSSDRLGVAVLSSFSADACRSAVRAVRRCPVVVTDNGGLTAAGVATEPAER